MRMTLNFFGKTACVFGCISTRAASSFTASSRSSFIPRSYNYKSYYNSRLISCTRTSCLAMISNSNNILDDKERTTPLISVEDCLKVQNHDNVVFVDGSWFLQPDRNGRNEYENGPRIPNAKYFDIDQIASTGQTLNPKNLPHMMPPKHLFASAMDAMNISNNDHIIVYATEGCTFVHRAWFQIRSMGHSLNHLHLMDGCISDWTKQGGTLETGYKAALRIPEDLDLESDSTKTKYIATDAQNVVTIDQVKQVVQKSLKEEDDNNDSSESDNTIIIDARSKERFLGQVNEPRDGVKSGRMPGSTNVFFMDLLDKENPTRFKSKNELKQIIQNGTGIDDVATLSNKTIITTCGSGATACAIICALEICGRTTTNDNTYIYDGSWTEWGSESDTPII